MADGFVSQREAVKRWRKRNPDKVREYNKRWMDKNPDRQPLKYSYGLVARHKWIDAHPEKYLLEQARKRAKLKDQEFSISVEDVVIPEACPLLDILMFLAPGTGYNPNSPSIDRLDNSKGYVKGNIWVISRKANEMKSDASIEQLRTFSERVLSLIN